jgi:hypothetical protein
MLEAEEKEHTRDINVPLKCKTFPYYQSWVLFW